MQVIKKFDPSATASGTINVNAADPGSKILLYNRSATSIQLNLEDGRSALLHAGEANWWLLDGATPTVDWVQYDTLNAANVPISTITGMIYGPGEEITGTYPVNLNYLFNLGNSIPLSSSTNQLVNTGNAPGTNIITAQPSDAASNTWSADNSGNLTVKGDNAGTLTTLLQLIAGASPGVKLAAAAILVEVLGNLQVDGTFSSDGATIATDGSGNITKLKSILFSGAGVNILGYTAAGDLLSVTGSNPNTDSHFKAQHDLWLEASGTQTAFVDGSGIHLNGNVQFDLGSTGVIKMRNGNTLQAVSSFDGTTTGTYNHGFGAAPFWVIPMCKVAGSQTMGFDSVTSTQVHITSFSGLGFRALCMA